MRGDFSRWTHDPKKKYSALLKQQGRVDSEADWNEAQAIQVYGTETRTSDVVGRCGAPADDPGFEISVSAGELRIGRGRYYVDGILCENEPDPPGSVPYLAQPDLENPPPIPQGIAAVYVDVSQHHVTAVDDKGIREPALGGPDTATRLRTVWQVRTLPLAVNLPLTPAALADLRRPGRLEARAEWQGLVRRSSGRLAARTEIPPRSTDPCIVPPTAGYRGLENQLYRVEVHAYEGATKTFKWSRDNGSVVAQWTGQTNNKLDISSAGRDRVLGFASGDWIELTDETRELQGRPGILVPITGVKEQVITIEPTQAIPLGTIRFADFPKHPKIRRWDSSGLVTIPSVASDQWVALEDGIEVQFKDDAAASYRSGDYWFIPARTAIGEDGEGDIEWPRSGSPAAAEPRPPVGPVHHYCCLALIQTQADGTVQVLDDCRERFPPLTDLTSLFYVGGDGQEGPAGEELPKALQVGVANGPIPVAGVVVRFRVQPSTAQAGLRDGGANAGLGAYVDVATDDHGIAGCFWTLAPAQGVQTVEAVLLDSQDREVHVPIRFEAHSLPSLFYVGGDGQDGIPGQPLPRPLEVGVAIRDRRVEGATVHFALEPSTGGGGLSRTGAETPASTLDRTTDASGVARCVWHLGPELTPPVVVARLLGSDGMPVHVPVRFGANLRVARNITYDPVNCPTLRGLQVTDVQAAIDALCRSGEAAGFVVTHLAIGDTELRNDTPYLVQQLAAGLVVTCEASVSPDAILDKPVCIVTIEWPFPAMQTRIGFQPIVLDGTLNVDNAQIFWTPSDVVRKWLIGNPLDEAKLHRALVRLTLKGNFIWKTNDPDMYLDGEVYGTRGELRGRIPRTDLRADRGDRRRGGDLEVWFWLVPPEPNLVLPPELDLGTVPVRRATEAVVPLRNVGTGTLAVNRLAITDVRLNGQPVVFPEPPLEVPTPVPLTVAPGARAEIRIEFVLPHAGEYSANLQVSSNDPDKPMAAVSLVARTP